MWNIILWIVFGGLAGWVASLIVDTDIGMGIWANIVVGIVGAFLGGWIVDMLTAGPEPQKRPTSLVSFAAAVLGAVLLLFLLNLIF
jgi:uncharacterized membrane protein YeaQ/YmgE (transglycosylase-associated protein family)